MIESFKKVEGYATPAVANVAKMCDGAKVGEWGSAPKGGRHSTIFVDPQ